MTGKHRDTFQCLKCRWHETNADPSSGTCPNFEFYCVCWIRDRVDLPQEGECGHFEEASA